jgi:hypothetical protein
MNFFGFAYSQIDMGLAYPFRFCRSTHHRATV